jgi:uncharacterized protein GlcG (DUF336 family)
LSKQIRELTLEEIRKMLQAANREANEVGKPSTIAIVDFGGHLRSLERPEGGRIANVDIAIKKAWTASHSNGPPRWYGRS